MSTNERELFSNNKIKEALCQFTFKQHLNAEFYQSFAERIKTKYSEVQDIPLVHFNFNFQDQNPQKIQSSGLRVSNKEKDKIVQIFTDNISIHQVGNYHQWEVFREDIYFVLSEFQKTITAEIGRIDLRTINVFEFDQGFNATDYFNVALNYPENFVQHSNFQFNLEQIYIPGKSAGVLRGNYVRENEKLKFILDLSYINWLLDSNINSSDTEIIKASLEEGHSKLYNLFVHAITNKTRELIKKK